jgi:hypothetical protein
MCGDAWQEKPAELVSQDVPEEGPGDESLAEALENLEQSVMDDAQVRFQPG